MRDGEGAHRAAVNYDVMRRHAESAQRAAHCENTCLIDVDLVDLAYGCSSDCVCDGSLADLHRQTDPLIVAQPLGVVDARDRAGIGGHDHGTGDDRPCNRTAAYLVDS